MNSIRLANVIFDMGEKLSQSKYELICEDIRSDRFTLSEHVCAYKKLDMVAGKNAYRLTDGTTVLVSPELIESLNSLSIDKNKLTTFMSQSEKNFKSVLRTIIDGRTESNC
jgi:hypothetical protein